MYTKKDVRVVAAHAVRKELSALRRYLRLHAPEAVAGVDDIAAEWARVLRRTRGERIKGDTHAGTRAA